jgi:tetraacyldisaccharide 4'-kinase
MYTPAPYLRPLLWLPGVLFESIMRARNGLYAARMIRTRRLSNPVLSVGNLSLGGTGKTPFVIYLAGLLTELGHTPALLTRGYLRTSGGETIISPGEAAPSVETCGDEPLLIRRHIPEIWLGISGNRYSAGRAIESRARPIFVLDDGFQHRGLARDLDIVLVDATQPFLRNRVVPRGSLREPLSALERADVIMINGIGSEPDSWTKNLAKKLSLFHCTQSIGSLILLDDWRALRWPRSASETPDEVFLVAAVGNPARFRRDVEALGIRVVGVRFYRDHTRLQPADWTFCIAEARRSGARALIVTEKDAVKLAGEPGFPVYVAVQSTRVEEQQQFKTLVERAVRHDR